MKEIIIKFFDIKFLKFVLVGVLNTICSLAIMFLLYNLLHFGYWGSSAVSYFLSSVLSFFLNKNFTFKNEGSLIKTAIKFSLNISICYVIAYTLAKPLVNLILCHIGLSVNIVDQISMVFGMILFTLLNYFGQRFFAFK